MITEIIWSDLEYAPEITLESIDQIVKDWVLNDTSSGLMIIIDPSLVDQFKAIELFHPLEDYPADAQIEKNEIGYILNARIIVEHKE